MNKSALRDLKTIASKVEKIEITEDIELPLGETIEYPRRFDDIIAEYENGYSSDFHIFVDDYNARTTKWDFFTYMYQQIDGAIEGGLEPSITYKQAFELACCYIEQKNKNKPVKTS